MLDNSGPYGPNDVPINMIAPMNNTQLGPMNTPHNLSNIHSFGGENPQMTAPQYVLPDYATYGHHSQGFNAQMNPYLNTNSEHVHRITYPIQTQNSYANSEESDLVSCNLDDRNFPNYYNAFHNNNKAVDGETSVESKQARNVPLNIPKVHINSYQKDNNVEQNFASIDNDKPRDFSSVDATETPLKLKETNSRSARLGKAIKHLENVIASDMLHRKKTADHKVEAKLKEIEFHNVDAYHSDKSAEIEIKVELSSDCEEEISEETSSGTNKSETVTSHSNQEYTNPFPKDMNGVSDSNVENRIISGENCVAEATKRMKKGKKTRDHFQCPHCSLLFSHPKRFIIHVKWHSFGLVNLKRQVLAEAKDLKMAIKRGEAVTGGTETFPCKDCDMVFCRMSALKGHRQKMHKISDRTCSICNTIVGDWQAYRAHIAAAHSGTLHCSHCNKPFKHKHTLRKHEETHKEKTLSCASCPKLFGSELLLRLHMKTHERVERGFTRHCSYCGKGFYHAYNLQVHERTHRDEKPFQCDRCNSRFHTNSSMKRHMKVSHSASKPHVCTTCQRSFTTAAIRDRHSLRLHGDQSYFKYNCEECSSKYLTLKDLKKHMSKSHPKRRRGKRDEISGSD